MIFSPLEPRPPPRGEGGDEESVRLYSPRHVAFASLLGGPFGGAALIGLNYQRCGRGVAALVTFGLTGLALLAFAMLAEWFLPSSYGFRALTVLGFLFMYLLAHVLQGAAHRENLRTGGWSQTYMRAAGIGVLAIVASAIAAAFVAQVGGVLYGVSYNLGSQDYELGDFDSAVDRFSFCLWIDPGEPYAHWYRGDSLLELGRLEEAERDFSVFVRAVPEDADGWGYRGYTRLERGNHSGAIADFTKALSIDPADTWALGKRGWARLNLEDYAGSIADTTRAIDLGANDGWAEFWRGIARSESGDHEGAIDDFTTAIRLEVELAASYYNRGLAKRAVGDLGGAQADFAQSRRLDPDDPDALAEWNEVTEEIRVRGEAQAK